MKSTSRVMVITDHPERLSIDFSLFDAKFTFCLPEKFKAEISINSKHEICFFKSSDEIKAIKKYAVIILDLERSDYNLNPKHLFTQLAPDSFIVVLDWSKKWVTSLKNIFWHFGILPKQMYEFKWNGKSVSLGDPIKLKSYFLVEPDLAKPSFLTMHAFKSEKPIHSNSKIKNLLKQIGGFYIFPHNRIFIFSRSIEVTSVVDDLIEKILILSGTSDRNFKIKKIMISRTGFLLLEVLISSEIFMIRFPLGRVSLSRLVKQHELIKFLNENGCILSPAPVNIKAEIHLPYFIETKIGNGVAPDKLIGKNGEGLTKLFEAISRKIEKFHLQFGKKILMSEDVYDKYLTPKIKLIKKLCHDNQIQEKLDIFSNNFLEILNKKTFLVGITHGDLKIGNSIFNSNGQLIGIIDWDMSDWEEITLIDLSALFITTIRNKYFPKQPIKEFMMEISYIPDEFLPGYKKYFDETDTSYLNPFISLMIYWLDRMSKMIQYHPEIDGQWVQKKVYPVLDRADLFFKAAKNESTHLI